MLTKTKLNVAVIGYGNMGTYHVQKYLQMEQVNLVAICDAHNPNKEISIDGTVIPICKSVDQLLSAYTIDAVSITSPTATHHAIGKQCLEAGLHCLIEKPIATTNDEANALIDLSNAKNLVLTVGHIERFNPAVIAVKKCIDEGMVGEIASLSFRRNGPFPKQIDDADVVIDLAVHDIDIANFWLGRAPDEIDGHKAALITGGRPDHAEILARYGSCNVLFQVNWITPTRVRTAVITGKKGYIEMDFIQQSLLYYPCKAEISQNKHGESVATFEAVEPESIPVQKSDSLLAECENFIDAILKGGQVNVRPEEARIALDLANKIK